MGMMQDMRINKSVIEKLKPCSGRWQNYLKYYGEQDFDLEQFIRLENITYSDKVWVVTRLFTKKQNVLLSIMCAESVLDNYEKEFPDNKAPRLAIEAAKNWLSNPCTETIETARSAARSAESAARSAAESAAESAESAAWSAAESAESAAWSAAESAWSAAWSAARSAAWSAAWSAARSAARSAAESAESAESDQELKNLSFMLECL